MESPDSTLLNQLHSCILSCAAKVKDPDAHEIFEPCAEESIGSSSSSVSAVLLSRANTSTSTRLVKESFRSSSSSQTCAQPDELMDKPPPQPAHQLPASVVSAILRHLNHAEYQSLRLSCRHWCSVITHVKPPSMPAVYFIPVEILQHMYALLRPVDFNAARHTCRKWMMASLHKALLVSMLKRAGWWGDARSDVALFAGRNGRGRDGLDEEWVLSKRLARECALGPDWTGNGLKRQSLRQVSMDDELIECERYASSEIDEKYLTGLSMTGLVDFSELGSASVASPHGPGIGFTVSVCGMYLMIAEGCLVYVYGLQPRGDDGTCSRLEYGGNLVALTCLVCPRRVLAVSMDSSSQRFAIAVLMDGRMGLVCDLHLDKNGGSGASSCRAGSSKLAYQLLGSCRLATTAVPVPSLACATTDDAISEPSTTAARASHETSGGQYDGHACMLNGALRGSIDEASADNNKTFRVESGPRSIYRCLCSDDDAPRSVAMCPQRRCVAFGSAKGIELHWVDALTGQDLSRWFPLADPSDCLFFVPPRRGVDSVKKLRLISSKARGLGLGFGLGRGGAAGLGDDEAVGWWGHLVWQSRVEEVGKMTNGHYGAVPLSDGYHVVFEDPCSGNVCLGGDAPVAGPTRLERRVVLVPPKFVSEEGARVGMYRVAADLKDGVVVVVCYGGKIVLYRVPGDVWEWCKSGKSKVSRGGESGDGEENMSWREFWTTDQIDVGCDEEGEQMAGGESLCPLKVRGSVFASGEGGVVELAVHTSTDSSSSETGAGSGLCVWAFFCDGSAKVWQVDDGQGRGVRRRWVEKGGRIREGRNAYSGFGVGGLDGSPGEEDTGHGMNLDAPGALRGFEDEGYACMDDGDIDMPDAPHTEPELMDASCSRRVLKGSSSGNTSVSLDSVEWIVDLLRNQVDVPDDEGFVDVLGVGRLECDIL